MTIIPASTTASLRGRIAGERRCDPRRLYAAWERIATNDAGDGATRIIAVQCHDLASAGFSFWTQAPPAAGYVVLSLAGATQSETRAEPLVLAAEVRHATSATCLVEPLFLVGCKFIS